MEERNILVSIENLSLRFDTLAYVCHLFQITYKQKRVAMET